MKRILLSVLLCMSVITLAHAQVFINTETAVSEYTASGVFIRNVVTSGLTSAYNTTFGMDGLLYVADGGEGAIKRFNPDTGVFVGNVISGLSASTDCKFGTDGNLYVSEYNNNRVLQVNPVTGSIMQAYTGINAALGLQFMPNGDLLATEGNSGGRIRRINTTTGIVSTFLTSTNIADVHLLPDGDYVFTDRNGSRLHRTTAAGGAFSDFTGGSVASFPYFMGNNATTLYVGSATNGVFRYDINSGAFLGSFGPGGASGVAIRPVAVTVPEASALALFAGFGIPGVVLIVRRQRNRA